MRIAPALSPYALQFTPCYSLIKAHQMHADGTLHETGARNFEKRARVSCKKLHLWDGAVVAVVSYVQTGEDRWLNMGTIDGKHWTVVTCARGEMTRIISARRSRRDEERYYEEHIC